MYTCWIAIQSPDFRRVSRLVNASNLTQEELVNITAILWKVYSVFKILALSFPKSFFEWDNRTRVRCQESPFLSLLAWFADKLDCRYWAILVWKSIFLSRQSTYNSVQVKVVKNKERMQAMQLHLRLHSLKPCYETLHASHNIHLCQMWNLPSLKEDEISWLC